MSETRLQTLRRLRSDRIRRRFAWELDVMARVIGCSGCGCDLATYTLACGQCLNRAHGRLRFPHISEARNAEARAFIEANKLEQITEQSRRLEGNTRTRGHVNETAGNPLIRQAWKGRGQWQD